MPAQTREIIVGWGKQKQTNISTANTVGQIWRLLKTNTSYANPTFINENDEDFLGKGHEFATTLYRSHVTPGPHVLEKFLTSEYAAWLWAFGLGKAVKSGAGPFTYTCTPLNLPVDGIELPYFSFIEQIRPGASDVLDRMLVGCAVRSFRILLSKGPGLANARATMEFVHSGKLTEPSGITMPAATAENLLNAYSAAITIIGVNYITPPLFESLEMGWDNDITDGFFPGSGQQNNFQIQGRLEIGKRIPVFNYVARFQDGSAEIDKVKNLTTGTATVTLTFDASNSMAVTWQKMSFSVAEIDDADGIVVVRVTGKPQYDTTNGVVSAVIITPVDNIGQ